MKISKHVHSCLLVEEAGKTFLLDPGEYTAQEKALDVSSISSIDYLLITHEHADHMHLPLVKEILAKFPNVKVISNNSVKEILGKESIEVQAADDDLIKLETVPHERMPFGEPPANVMITIAGKLADPGDSHHFETKAEILALPVQAPWGSTAAAVELAVKLKPKVIIPIHDWHWNNQARQIMYKRLEEFFAKIGIKFLCLQTGQVVEI